MKKTFVTNIFWFQFSLSDREKKRRNSRHLSIWCQNACENFYPFVEFWFILSLHVGYIVGYVDKENPFFPFYYSFFPHIFNTFMTTEASCLYCPQCYLFVKINEISLGYVIILQCADPLFDENQFSFWIILQHMRQFGKKKGSHKKLSWNRWWTAGKANIPRPYA